MILFIRIHCLDAGNSVVRCSFTKAVKERQNLFSFYPVPGQFAWHLVLEKQFLDQPVCNGLLLEAPRRQVEDDRYCMRLIPLCPLYEVTGEFEQQGGFARAR